MSLVNTKESQQSPADEYLLACIRLITAFRADPFNLPSNTLKLPIGYFKILNRRVPGTLSSGDLMERPYFQYIRRTAVDWVRRELDDYKREINTEMGKEETGTTIRKDASWFKLRQVPHEIFRKVLEKLGGAIGTAHKIAHDCYHDQTWAGSTDKISQCIVEVTGSLSAIEVMDQKPLRFAFCGRVKAGKSTALNVILGSSMLPTSANGCTGWPTVIRHETQQPTPRLVVDSDFFSEHLERLRCLDLPKLIGEHQQTSPKSALKSRPGQNTQADTDSISAEQLVASYYALHPELRTRLDQFLQSDFKIKDISTAPSEIEATNKDISDLLRVLYKLLPRAWRPKKEVVFPLLHLPFSDIGATLSHIEFVDLPGLGDAGIAQADVENMYQKAMAQCEAVVFVAKAYPDQVADSSTESGIKLIRQATQDSRPLVVIGTHSDASEYSGWEEQHALELTKIIFPGADPEKMRQRSLYCAPALYQESKSLDQRAMTLSDQEVEKLRWDDLYASHKKLMTYHYTGTGSRFWQKENVKGRREVFRRGLDESNAASIPNHLRKYLELEVKDLRYAVMMNGLRDSLEKLWKEQQEILDASSTNGEALDTARKDCERFKEAANAICAFWAKEEIAFRAESDLVLERKLEEAKAKGDTALLEVVQRVAKKFDGDKEELSFNSQQNALDFLAQVANELKERLDDIQAALVDDIRMEARKAWEGRISTLENYIKTSKSMQIEAGSVSASLKEEITVKLVELSSEKMMEVLSNLVENKVNTGNTGHGSSKFQKWLSKLQPWRSRDIAQDRVIKKHRKTPSTANKKTKSDQKEAKREQERFLEELTDIRISGLVEKLPPSAKKLDDRDAREMISESVNLLGFLIRAPVLATAASCPITVAVWPFLAKSGVSLPIPLKIQDAIATYRMYTMDAWYSALDEECRTSIGGAIDMSSRVGTKAVLDIIAKRQDALDDIARQCAKPLAEDMEESLVFMQANFLGALSAVEELLRVLVPSEP